MANVPLSIDQRRIIIALIARSTEGASLPEISAVLTPVPDVQTMRRWLEDLTEDELVLPKAAKDGVRYVAFDAKLLLSLSSSLKSDTAAKTPAPTESVSDSRPGTAPLLPASSSPSLAAFLPSLDSPSGAPNPLGGQRLIPSYTALFAASAPRIVVGLMPKAAATEFLQMQATLCLATSGERQSFVAYSLARLDILTVGDAAAYGIKTEQYARWREINDDGTRHSRVAESAAGSMPLGGSRGPDLESSAANQSAAGAASSTGDKVPAAPIASSASLPHEAQSTKPGAGTPADGAVAEVAEIAEPLGLRGLIGLGKQMMKETITPGRALVGTLWGMAIVVLIRFLVARAATHVTPLTVHQFEAMTRLTSLVAIPLCGLPWLFVRWLDRIRTYTRLDGFDIPAMVFLGGAVTFLVGKIAVAIFDHFGF